MTDGARVVVATAARGSGDPGWLDLDSLMELLETVGAQLEKGDAGSRFPLVWRIALALTEDAPYAWSSDELGALTRELETIENECETIPAASTPTFVFYDEGYPDIYFRKSPNRQGTARARFQNVLARFLRLADEARKTGHELGIERRGPVIEWWSH